MGLTFTAAAALVGVDLGTIPALVLAGRLRVLAETAGRTRPRLDENSVRRFAARFAPARLYADVLGCRPDQAARQLRSMGVTALPLVSRSGQPLRDLLVCRTQVRRRLRLESDPVEPAQGLEGEFWTAFRQDLAQRNSPMRLLRTEGLVAHVAYGNVFRGQLIASAGELALEVRGHPAASKRTYRVLGALAAASDGCAFGGKPRLDAATGTWILRATLSMDRFSAGATERALDWVLGALGRLRPSFSRHGPRRIDTATGPS